MSARVKLISVIGSKANSRSVVQACNNDYRRLSPIELDAPSANQEHHQKDIEGQHMI
jgi:hypothetical protein